MHKHIIFISIFLSFLSAAYNDLGLESYPLYYLDDHSAFSDIDLIVEDYYELGIEGINAAGPFTIPSREVYFLGGGNAAWTRHSMNGFDNSDPYFEGASRHKPLFLKKDVQFYYRRHKVEVRDFFPDSTDHQKLILESGYGGFGPEDYELGEWLYDNIVPELFAEHPSRSDIYSLVRRKSLGHVRMEWQDYSATGRQAFLYTGGQRLYPKVLGDDIDGSFTENYHLLQYAKDSEDFAEIDSIRMSFLRRDALGADLFFNVDELSDYNYLALSLAENREPYSAEVHLSVRSIDRQNDNFNKNIIDQDGMSWDPYFSDRHVYSLDGSLSYDHVLEKRRYFDWYTRSSLEPLVLFENNTSDSSEHALYYDYKNDWQALYYLENDYENYFQLTLPLIFEAQTHPGTFTTFSLSAGSESLIQSGAYYHFVRGSAQMDIGAFNLLNWTAKANVGVKTLDTELKNLYALAPSYREQNWYYWDDSNDDRLYSEDERGALYRKGGNSRYSVSDDLKLPRSFYFSVPLNYNRAGFSFWLNIDYEMFSGLWDISLVDQAAYGEVLTLQSTNTTGNWDEYERSNESYYLLTNANVKYAIANMNSQAYPEQDWMLSNPFFAGAFFKVQYQRGRFQTSWSFYPYIIHGPIGWGNGPLENQLGQLEEANAYKENFHDTVSRLAQDRGYISKWMTRFAISRSLTASFHVRYRDGEPLTHYLAALTEVNGEDQLALHHTHVRGDNIYTEEFGERQDANWNFEINLMYRPDGDNPYEAGLHIYNLLDAGTTASENAFYGRRDGLTSVNPRGIRVFVQRSW